MKLRKLIRWQLILAGLGAALFLTPSAQSQEITNTAFDDGPNVVAFAQPDVVAQPSAEATPAQAVAPSVNEVASIQASLAPQHDALIDSPWTLVGLTALLLACLALSAIGESKRTTRRPYAARRYPSYRGA